ncbi:MAG TPA: hypothetical protein VF286_14050, partial [Acidiphilium sp.]
ASPKSDGKHPSLFGSQLDEATIKYINMPNKFIKIHTAHLFEIVGFILLSFVFMIKILQKH